MLRSLTISNYALIDSITIEFEKGFSVITGETGAGKSILLGALGLILGQRADTSVLMDQNQKCVVEGMFDIAGYQLEKWMIDSDLDYDPVTIIRREVLPAGKSRAFINDSPVNLNTLKDFTSILIDIHSQHQTLLLAENQFQLKVVDLVSGSSSLLKEYRDVYSEHRKVAKELNELIETHNQQKADVDYWEFQYNQLNEAGLSSGEQSNLEQRLEQLTHAEEIKNNFSQIINSIDGEHASLLNALREAKNLMSKISGYIDSGEDYFARLESAYIDLKDLAEDLQARSESIEYLPGEIEEIQARLSLIYELQHKHQVNNVDDLIGVKNELQHKLDQIENFEEELELLKNKLNSIGQELTDKANKLSEKRLSVFPVIESFVVDHLKKLGMPHARLQIDIVEKNEFGTDGKDDIIFMFSANKSGQLAPISRVASGGEMSRLMLCIKALISSSKDLPTLILDEIDTGISGETAHQMGVIMDKMAQECQLITITHLPQIAGKGDKHYKVYKVDDAKKTTSKIELLDNEQRVVEIAKMLSGSELSDAAMRNARELLRN